MSTNIFDPFNSNKTNNINNNINKDVNKKEEVSSSNFVLWITLAIVILIIVIYIIIMVFFNTSEENQNSIIMKMMDLNNQIDPVSDDNL